MSSDVRTGPGAAVGWCVAVIVAAAGWLEAAEHPARTVVLNPYAGVDWEPRPDNFPANPTWPWSDYGCASPEELGVVGIQGNELTYRHPSNSYFSNYGVWYHRTFRNGHPRSDGNGTVLFPQIQPDQRSSGARSQRAAVSQDRGDPRYDQAGTISVQASHYDTILWNSAPKSREPVADYKTSNEPWPRGRVVHRGTTLSLCDAAHLGNYVRVELHRQDGEDLFRTFTNPFGLDRRP